ncbi:GATA transcription factor 4-like [Wolffia australiana]
MEAESSAEMQGRHSGEIFLVEDLLDFSNDDGELCNVEDKYLNDQAAEESVSTPLDCSSSSSVAGSQIRGDFACNCLLAPIEDMEQLEWLSKFVEDSFSVDPPLAQVRSRVGSKRPRLDERVVEEESINKGSERRRCVHCATDRTPQWRAGPKGPKTLCNACGVRFKSGRLVPEYRPAASPTFEPTQHSNSHRKVLELRHLKVAASPSLASSAATDGGVQPCGSH